jgi:hypothetical protein
MTSHAGRALALLLAATLGPLAVGSRHRAIGSAAIEQPVMTRAPRGYQTRQIEGWTVLVNRGFLEREPDLADRTFKLLGFQLYQVTRVIPPDALSKLRKIRIWVEEKETEPPCMTYHPDPGWLREHGKDPEKARSVELANARNFLSWTIEQPWMLLHELSHGYHHQFLARGFDNPRVKAAYDHAMKAGLYDRVLRYSGQEEKAYAATNPMEYFAEATEAYFGTNDFFPFVRIELKRHDPMAYETLERLWGVTPPAAKKSATAKKPAVPRKPTGARTTANPKGRAKGRS